MTEKSFGNKDHRTLLIKYWIEKAHESIESAQNDYNAKRYTPAVRNIYYACFYALTSVLLNERLSFKKHTAVKAALHKKLIKPGILEPVWGKFYNKIFDRRHEGDYQPLHVFDKEEVNQLLDQAAGFISVMEALLIR